MVASAKSSLAPPANLPDVHTALRINVLSQFCHKSDTNSLRKRLIITTPHLSGLLGSNFFLGTSRSGFAVANGSSIGSNCQSARGRIVIILALPAGALMILLRYNARQSLRELMSNCKTIIGMSISALMASKANWE
jgi:hypothetical protein